MKALEQILKNRTTAVFFDLEATGVSHEIIEIGAFKVTLRPDGSVKKAFKPFHYYVIPKSKIGVHVTHLTGITEKMIEENGVPFRVMQKSLAKYVGKDYKNAIFVCYGDQDSQMFIASAENNLDASMEDARFVAHHCFNFLHFFSHYVTGEDGNPISLTKACELFGIKIAGKAHSATTDAYSLLKLYEAFLSKKDLVAEEYAKRLFRGRGIPDALRILLKRIEAGESIDKAALVKIVRESIE